MAEINNADVELSASQLKFYMAVKELEKRNQLNDLFDHLNLKSVAKQEPNETSKAVIDTYMKFSADAMKVIVKNHPEVIEEIQKKIDAQDLSDEFEAAGVKGSDLEQDTIDFLKTTKHFESEFPDPDKPSLKERMVAAKDAVLGALGSDKGKVAVNAVMLGVAVGTGGAGILAGAKLVAAVANMAMKNPSVAKTFEKVQGKVTDYLVDAGVDVSSIAKGHQLVVHTLKDQVEKRPWLSKLAVPALLVGAAVGAVLLHQDFDAVKNLAGQAQDYAEKLLNGDVSSIGFSPELGDSPTDLTSGVDFADQSASTPDASVATPDVATSPSDAGIATPESGIPTPDNGVTIDSPDVVADAGQPTPSVPATDSVPSSTGVEAAQALAGSGGVHVVNQGESIWKITKGLLPEGASNHDIAMGVQAFIDANPSVASHPNLIFPGDNLVIPDHLQPSVPTVQPAMVSEVANVLSDVKIDAPQIVPVMPDIDLSALELTSMDPNPSAVVIPDAAITLANEAAASKDVAKEVVKSAVDKGSSFSI